MAKITTQLPGTIVIGGVITNTSELINDGDTGVSTYVEFTDIGLVAESNNYNDLTNLPNIPTNLDSLTDVTINSALNDDFLKFDSITSLWKNIQLTGALILSKLGFTPENISNKQNSLLVDGTGLKYPTVDAVNSALSSLSIPDASETVSGKVNILTQTFKGNKTIVGESSSVGNALEIQNLAHTKLVQIANTGIVTLMNILNVMVTSPSSFILKLGYGGTNYLGFIGDGRIVSTNSGKFGASNIGGDFAHSSAILQADSTAKGFLPPRMTTTQKNAIATPIAGLMVFDTTLMKLCIFTTAWETITSI